MHKKCKTNLLFLVILTFRQFSFNALKKEKKNNNSVIKGRRQKN